MEATDPAQCGACAKAALGRKKNETLSLRDLTSGSQGAVIVLGTFSSSAKMGSLVGWLRCKPIEHSASALLEA